MLDGKNIYFLVYVDLGNGATDNLMMAFSFAGTSTSRIWEIKVSQIECNNLNRLQLTILSCKMCSLNLDKILKKWANLIILLGSKLEYLKAIFCTKLKIQCGFSKFNSYKFKNIYFYFL